MEDLFVVKTQLSATFLIFWFGIVSILVRREGLWIMLGPLVSFKAIILSAILFFDFFHYAKPEFIIVILLGTLLIVLLTLVGAALLLRAKGISKVNGQS